MTETAVINLPSFQEGLSLIQNLMKIFNVSLLQSNPNSVEYILLYSEISISLFWASEDYYNLGIITNLLD